MVRFLPGLFYAQTCFRVTTVCAVCLFLLPPASMSASHTVRGWTTVLAVRCWIFLLLLIFTITNEAQFIT